MNVADYFTKDEAEILTTTLEDHIRSFTILSDDARRTINETDSRVNAGKVHPDFLPNWEANRQTYMDQYHRNAARIAATERLIAKIKRLTLRGVITGG
jgi:hypothetical protein